MGVAQHQNLPSLLQVGSWGPRGAEGLGDGTGGGMQVPGAEAQATGVSLVISARAGYQAVVREGEHEIACWHGVLVEQAWEL